MPRRHQQMMQERRRLRSCASLVHIVGDGVNNDLPVDALVLRQFVAPNVLITNRKPGDTILNRTDKIVHGIVGVVIPESA